MILDSITNWKKYATVHPLFAKAFEFLIQNDLSALEKGKIKLDGDNLIVNIVDITGKEETDAKMESHKNFIDIQIPVGNSERMGWLALKDAKEISMEYDQDKDLIFYADKATTFLDVQPMEFAIFFPEDCHQPGISEGTYRKIIVKVRY